MSCVESLSWHLICYINIIFFCSVLYCVIWCLCVWVEVFSKSFYRSRWTLHRWQRNFLILPFLFSSFSLEFSSAFSFLNNFLCIASISLNQHELSLQMTVVDRTSFTREVISTRMSLNDVFSRPLVCLGASLRLIFFLNRQFSCSKLSTLRARLLLELLEMALYTCIVMYRPMSWALIKLIFVMYTPWWC